MVAGVVVKRKRTKTIEVKIPLVRPHEKIKEGHLNLSVPRRCRPVLVIELYNCVEGISVPYAIDEDEYLKRLQNRDEPRIRAKELLDNLRKIRGELKTEGSS
jgi:hypothetical protein